MNSNTYNRTSRNYTMDYRMKSRRDILEMRRERKRKILMQRRIASIIILSIIIVVIASISVFITNADNTDKPIVFEKYTVASGDTLWTIAENIGGNFKIRDVIHVIRNKNNIQGSTIYVGQIIEIPVLE